MGLIVNVMAWSRDDRIIIFPEVEAISIETDYPEIFGRSGYGYAGPMGLPSRTVVLQSRKRYGPPPDMDCVRPLAVYAYDHRSMIAKQVIRVHVMLTECRPVWMKGEYFRFEAVASTNRFDEKPYMPAFA